MQKQQSSDLINHGAEPYSIASMKVDRAQNLD